jgi:hypothetical protein
MPEEQANNTGRYLYAVVHGTDSLDYGPIGIDDSAVYIISDGTVSAVVSDVPNKKLRPQRKNLAAHQNVLKKIMENSTPLPMAFGIIANGEKALRKILADNKSIFTEQLKRTAGKVEMGMRVSYDVPNIFEYFISIHADLRAARDRFFGGYREPSQEAKLELGRMFDRLLNEDREEYTSQVEEVLAPYCYETARSRIRNEQEVMNLACLVGRDEQGRFEEGVFAAAGLFNNNFSFEYNGPWAPHNFVNIQLAL